MTTYDKHTHQDTTEPNLDDIVADSDTGGRSPTGVFSRLVLWYTPLIWSLYQLWIASPLPFALGIGVWNDTQTRAIHLGFAVFLAFVAFPAFKFSPKHHIPVTTWLTALVGAICVSYLAWDYSGIAARTGAPNQTDVIMGAIGMVMLLEAARRSLGFPLVAVALIFLTYVFFGSWSGLPDMLQWKGASFNKAMSHLMLTTEGVFGVALGVSSSFVFLFVLFGALLNQAGAGNYFLQLAFAALGHLRGGPAKAAVIGSAATGIISGSSIANVVTTGTFTIPLMKKVGFSPSKAGAIEVSSSINGVLTPPVMGAVAFLMTEYVGISYVEVVKTAIIPAAISYVALIYIVHLEALKMGMTGTSKMHPVKFMLGAIFTVAISIIIAGLTLWGAGQVVQLFDMVMGPMSTAALVVLMMGLYVAAVRYASRFTDLEQNIDSLENLPPARTILKTGLHYLLPILLLMYLLMIERKSPGLSAFWSSMFMLVILFTQDALKAFFRNQGEIAEQIRGGISKTAEGLVIGARNMIGLASAMGVAGIIVGAVTMTGVGQVMAEFVEFLSGGNVLAMLFFVALISIVLGMGLPTTANYIVVSSLMAGVVVELGAQNGLIVPLVAVHMFVFYFGIMADVTPPVGLASFAAAAISKGDPLKTGVQAFFYSIRTALLPFLFIFNTDLLLINVGPVQAVFVFIIALIAMLMFAAGTMNYFIVKSKLWESLALIFAAFILFQPQFFLNKVIPEFDTRPAADVYTVAGELSDGNSLRVRLTGWSIEGNEIDARYLLPLGPTGTDGADRLSQNAGIEFREEDGQYFVDFLTFAGPADQLMIGYDMELVEIEVTNERPPKELFYLPAFLILGAIFMIQRRRKEKTDLKGASA